MNITIPPDTLRAPEGGRTFATPVSKTSTQDDTLFDNVLAEYSTPNTPIDEHFPNSCDKAYLSPLQLRYSTTPRLPPDIWSEDSHTSPHSKRGGIALGSPIRFNKYDDCDKLEEEGEKRRSSPLKTPRGKLVKPKSPESPRRYMTRVEQTLGDEEDEVVEGHKQEANKRRNWLSMSFVTKMRRGSKQDSPKDSTKRHSMANLPSPSLRMPSISSTSTTASASTSISGATATSANTCISSRTKNVVPSLRKRLSREIRRHSTFGLDEHDTVPPPRKYTPDMISLPRVTSMSSFSNAYIPKRPAPPPSPSTGSSPSFRNSISDLSSLRSTPPPPLLPRHARVRDDIDTKNKSNDKPFFERSEVDEMLRKATWTKTSDECIDEEEEEDEEKVKTPILNALSPHIGTQSFEAEHHHEKEVKGDDDEQSQDCHTEVQHDDQVTDADHLEINSNIDDTPQSTHTTTFSTNSLTLDDTENIQYLDLDFGEESKEQETSLISMFDRYLNEL